MSDYSQLLESDESFLQALPVGYVAIRADGALASINQSLASALGYEPRELLGRPADEFLFDDSSRQVFIEQFTHRARGVSGAYALQLRGRGDACLSVVCFAVPQYRHDGAFWGSRAVVVPLGDVERHAEQLRSPSTFPVRTDQVPMIPATGRLKELDHLLQRLTRRERDVVELLRSGLRVQGVAQCLNLSHYTVRNHLKRIFRKAEVSSQGELLMKLNGPAQSMTLSAVH